MLTPAAGKAVQPYDDRLPAEFLDLFTQLPRLDRATEDRSGLQPLVPSCRRTSEGAATSSPFLLKEDLDNDFSMKVVLKDEDRDFVRGER